ncbi:MAG: glycosyltransferase family 39 protein [Planctomycetota bacterium]
MLLADDDRKPLWPWLLGVALVAVAARIGLGLIVPADIDALPDQREYLDLAASIRAGEGLVLVDDRYAVPQTLLAQRMPGYPLFLASFNGNVSLVRIAQAIIEATTAISTVLLAGRFVARRFAVFAGVLVALNPFLAYFSTLILTETLTVALFTWGLYAIIRSQDGARWWWLAAAFFVVATYVRPSSAVVFVLLAVVAAILPTRGPGGLTRWPLPGGLTAGVVLLLALSPWIWRNFQQLQAFVPLTTNTGITLYDGLNVDNTTGQSDQSFVQRMPQLSLMGEVDRSTYLRGWALHFVTERPVEAARLAVLKTGRTWSPLPLSDDASRLQRIAGLAFALPVFVLALIGLVAGRLPLRPLLVMLTPVIVLTLLHAITVGSLRYRLPIEPVLAILGAAGLGTLLRSRSNRDVSDDVHPGKSEAAA